MDLGAESLPHFPSSYIGNGVQCQTVEQLVVIQQILPYAVHDKVQQLMLLVEEQSHGKIANLLLRVFLCRDQVDGLEMAKINIPAQNVDVEELADVFLLVVATQVAILEFLPNIGQFLVDSLLFQLASARISQVGNELHQASHVRIAATRTAEEAASWCRHGQSCPSAPGWPQISARL